MSVDDGLGTVTLTEFVKWAENFRKHPDKLTLTFTYQKPDATSMSDEYKHHGIAVLYFSPTSRVGGNQDFLESRTCPKVGAYETLASVLGGCNNIGLNFEQQSSFEIDKRVHTRYVVNEN